MSLSTRQLQAVLEECQSALEGSRLVSVEEGACETLILHFSTETLLLSFFDPLIRMHLSRRRGLSPSSTFASKLLVTLRGKTLSKINLYKNDRIAYLDFTEYQLIAELIPRKANCYLLTPDKTILYTLKPCNKIHYEAPPVPEFLAKEELLYDSKTLDESYNERERQVIFRQEKARTEQALAKQEKRCDKQKNELFKQLNEAQQWQSLAHQGQLLQANLYRIEKGMKAVEIDDWEIGEPRTIALDPYKTPAEQIETLFKLSRKRKKAVPYLEKLLVQKEKTKEEIADKRKALEDIDNLSALRTFIKKERLEQLPKKAAQRTQQKKTPLPFRSYRSASKMLILVGKKAADNDKLTFHYANGSDWWLHVSDYAGSHVVIRCKKGQKPDEETIHDAMQLALSNSQAKKTGEADITITECKYVSRTKQQAKGQVHISKHHKRYCRLDESRLAAIKSRKR